MLAIAAAVVFGIYLLLDLADVGSTDLFNFPTFASLGLLLLSLHLAGIGGGNRPWRGRRPGRG